MDKKPELPDLSPEKLARLWAIGSDIQPEAEQVIGLDDRKAELLRDRLARNLPLDKRTRGFLSETLDLLCRKFQPFVGNSLGAMIMDPQTSVEVLTYIKDFAKESGSTARDKAERDVALAVYFAAIASALVCHGARISQHSGSRLRKAFEAWVERSWLPSDMRELFKKAMTQAEL